MSIDSVNRQYTNLVRSIGQAALSSLSPHDFEYYMVALELTDGSGRTIDYFSFPVLPTSIQKTEPKRTNIKQSNTGITVLSFGAMNLLRAIIAKSNGIDDQGLPFRLYFYNMALGESYLVTVPSNGLTLNTDADNSNTLWNYNLTLTAIAPLSLVLSKKAYEGSLKNSLQTGIIQKGVNVLSNQLGSLIQKWATDTLP